MTKTPARGQERGAALIEAALTIPLLLLVAVGIFEFGRAYQTWQVLTNAAREAARYAVTPGATADNAQTIAQTYMTNGALSEAESAAVAVDQAVPLPGGVGNATTVTITYPFSFMYLQPIAALVSGTPAGAPLTMTATTTMRNE